LRKQPKKIIKKTLLSAALLAAATLGFAAPASDHLQPHLETRHGVRQLIVDGQPFLVLSGELGNSSASSRAFMKPVWNQLAQRNLNTVIASVTWQMIEPVEGRFDFTSVDNCIEDARAAHLHLVFLWFASWKNGQSSYPPDWVKNDPQRFPWVKDRAGNTLNILTTFSDATRDADARAYAALMRHIREVDGKDHTVLMMQVENEVGIVGDSRDHCPAANEAFAKPVPEDLMDYLVQHKETLAPELLEAWKAAGFKTNGTWEQVFGPGKPAGPLPQLSQQERDVIWRKVVWAPDEFFMAWRYSTYVNKVAAAGKAEYDIPMYCNAWLQQPGGPRPGEYPCGGPNVQVHDIWRFGAPSIDFLAPDLYMAQFDEISARFTRNGNPLFVPEANTGGPAPGNALIALIKYNGIGFSPFAIERERPGVGRGGRGGGGRGVGGGRGGPAPTADAAPGAPIPAAAPGAPATPEAPVAPAAPSAPPPDAFAQTYGILQYLAPVILDNQGKGTIAFLNETTETNAAPQETKMGDYTLLIRYGASAAGGGRGGRGGRGGGGGFGGFGGGGGSSGYTNVSPIRLVINTGPGAFVFVGGPMSVTFKPTDPSKGTVVLGSTVETMYQDGHWVPGRWMNGDETQHNSRQGLEESPISMGSFGIYGYSVFQRK
jgi:uncharacterized membrane protein YgcG